MTLDVRLYDEVTLNDEECGICKFIGEVKSKKGLFYGIEMKSGKGKNNGIVNNRRYFRTKKDKQSGRFTQISKIIKTLKTPKSIRLTVGDEIDCPHLNTSAIIRYVGIPAFDKTQSTVYFGVELLQPVGDCNGTMFSAYLGKKVSYFKCKEQHGLYVKASDVCIMYKPKNGDDDKTYYQINKRPKDDISDDNDNDQNNANSNDQIAQLKELIKYKQSEHEKVMKEYAEYKEEMERDNEMKEMQNRLKVLQEGNRRLTVRNEQIAAVNKEYKDVNASLKEKYEELEAIKLNLKNKAFENGKYEELLKEFNEYKEKNEKNESNDDQKEDVDALKSEIEKLKEQNNALQEKYKKTKQKLQNLTGQQNSANNNNESMALEKELEALKATQKNKDSTHRISGVLNKFAATDINSATVILKEILKHWDSKYISAKSRVDYLNNLAGVMGIISNTMDMSKKNEELDPIINKVLDIISLSRDSDDDTLSSTAADLSQDDVILQFMMRR